MTNEANILDLIKTAIKEEFDVSLIEKMNPDFFERSVVEGGLKTEVAFIILNRGLNGIFNYYNEGPTGDIWDAMARLTVKLNEIANKRYFIDLNDPSTLIVYED